MVFFFSTATLFTSVLADPADFIRRSGASSADCSTYTCSYTVASGDTLSTIATALTAAGAACTWKDLCDCNGLSDCDTVVLGSTLQVPCGTGPTPTPSPTPPPSADGEWTTWTGMGITYHGEAYDVATYCPASASKPIGNACWSLDNQPTFKPTVLAPYCASETSTHMIAFGHPATLNCGECAEIRVMREDGSYNQIVVMTTDNPGSGNTSPELTTAGKSYLTQDTGKQLGDRLPFDWRKVDCVDTRRFELPAPTRRVGTTTDCSTYTCSYTVASGDTLSTIATALTASGAACTWKDLCDCNGLSDCNTVGLGSTLKVPCGSGPTPSPTSIVGYYAWTWGTGSTGPAGANAGVAFGGVIDVDDAINSMKSPSIGGTCWVPSGCPTLRGTKYLNLGGNGIDTSGNPDPKSIWTTTNLAQVTADASKIPAAGYQAVIFDVESATGSSSALVPGFQAAFQAMKENGLTVAVTISHSAPVTTSPATVATDLVKAFCADSNVDVISPQLYRSGTETAPSYVETANCATLTSDACSWDLFKTCKAKFVPGIVEASQYADAKDHFQQTYGITSEGYFQWKQQL